MKFYEINKGLDEILTRFIFLDDDQVVDADTGEILADTEADVIMAELENLQMAKEEKRENIACWIKGMDAEVAAIKEEEKRLALRRKMLENKRERIFNFLFMELNGDKVSSPRVKVSYRKTTSVEVTNMDELPDEYRRVKITEEADKTAIKEAFKAGVPVVGAKLVERLSMSIK